MKLCTYTQNKLFYVILQQIAVKEYAFDFSDILFL